MRKYLTLVGIIVGLIIAIQLNSKLLPNRDINISEKNDIDLISQELNNEKIELTTKLEKLKEEEAKKQEVLSKNIQSDLIKAEKEASFTKEKGEGVIFTLSVNNEDNYNTEQQTKDLRNIINLLFSLKAEAISLNDYRINFKTPIISVGNNILVEKNHLTYPFKIKVIGNINFILSALETKELISDLKEKINENILLLEVKKDLELEIPAYFNY